ncbi:MAG: alkaline phosphatase D family protein, partial [Verrucomicrobiota bacterium]
MIRRLSSTLLCLFIFSISSAQHDAQRDAMIALHRGDGSGYAEEFINPRADAGRVESHVIAMMRALSIGDTDEAIKRAEGGLAAGLNPARLWAGGSEWLAELRAHPRFESLPGVSDVPAVIHGPMLGAVTDTSAKTWIRLRESGTVRGRVGEQTTEPFTADQPGAYAAVIDWVGLDPATRYDVVIEKETAEGWIEIASVGFDTHPPADEGAVFEVAFGGGAGYIPEWERMWDTIRGFEPEAMLMLGDNVYIDDPTQPETQWYCYHRRQSLPEWRRLIAEVPIYSIYDDHDFGDNDCMPGPAIDKPAWKRPVWEVFRSNWANPGYGGGDQNPGCWYHFAIADVEFWMLDGRYYRHRESKSMLGPVQREWLLKGLAASQATFKVIVSPVPFTPGIKPGSLDPWDGYPEEREAIFDHIADERIEGVFLVAADRHRTDLRRIDRDDAYPLYEFESSRLTNRHTHGVVETEGLIWGYRDQCSFGLIEFDTIGESAQARFRCINIDGEEQEEFLLDRSL